MVISKITNLVLFEPRKIFQKFAEETVSLRRSGDENGSAALSNTAKALAVRIFSIFPPSLFYFVSTFLIFFSEQSLREIRHQ